MPDTPVWDNIKTSLTEGLRQVFPIVGKERDLHLEDIDIKDNKDAGDYASQKQAILNKTNWTVPVYGNLVLKDKEGKTLEKSRTRLLSIPKLTNRNTLIYNGNEYSIANQIRLKPGVYTNTGDDGITRSQFNVGKGANFSLWQEPTKGIFYMQFNQASIPLYPILKDLGVSDEELASRWGREIVDSNKNISDAKYKNAVVKVYNKLTYNKNEEKETSYDTARSELKNVLNVATLDPLVTKATLKKEYSAVTSDVIMDASRKILRINRGEEQPDDRESLVYKSVHGADDFIRESITKAARPVLWKVKNRLNSMYGKQDGSIIKNVFAPGTLSSPIYTNINISPLTSVAQDANPLKSIEASNRVTAFGPGGIGSTLAVPEAVRNVHPSHIGFIDTVRTQESDKAGIDLQLAIGTRKTGNTLTIKLLDRDGKKVRKTIQELQGKTLALPSQQINGKIDAVRDGKAVTVSQSDIDYTIYGPNRMFSDATVLVPFLSNNAGARVNIGGKMGAQALPLKYREKPLVQTAANKEGLTNEAIIGRKISVQSPVDGKVTKVTGSEIEITDGSGKKHSVSLYANYIVGNKTYLNHEPVVKEGDKVIAGQLLADSNYSKDGVLAMGTNLKTIYVPYKGLSVSGDSMVLWVDMDGIGHFTSICEVPPVKGIRANALKTDDLAVKLHDIHSFIGHYTDEEMVEVLTMDGTSVKATKSHSFISIDDDGVLHEIAPGDMVAGKTLLPVARPQLPLRDSVQIIALKTWRENGREISLPLSEDIGFLFGMYVSEGSPLGGKKPKGICIAVTEEELLTKATQILDSFDIPSTYYKRVEKNGSVRGALHFHSAALTRFIVENCGRGAAKKRVPRILWSSNPAFVKGFISGYWSGDGTVGKLATASTASKELAEGICFLLASIGVRATYRTYKTSMRDQHLISVFSHSLSMFPDIFLSRKNEALLELKAKSMSCNRDRVPVPAKDREAVVAALGRRAISNNGYISRGLLLEALEKGADLSPRLVQLIHSRHIWWDVVKSVKEIAFEDYVYDLDMRPVGNFMVGSGLIVHNTFEDAIVVSDSAAQKFTSQHMSRFDLPVDDTTVLNKNKWLAYFDNKVTPAQTDKLDARGIVKPGMEVGSGDYLIAAMRENVVNPEDAMLGKLSRKLVKPYRDVSVLWEKATAGRVVDVVVNPKSVTITVRTDAPLVIGDKITNREGGKGVVASILPDAEMPKDKDGNPYEVILNPATVMSRMNIGQLLETAVSKTATPDKPYVAPLFPAGKEGNISREVKKILDERGVKETDEVYDAHGKKGGDIFAGKQYFYKLGKTTDTNYSARAFQGKYDADMMPVRGGEEGAKGVGLLDIYALLSHNARNILRESVTSKAEYNPEYFKAIQMGMPLPPPKPTFAFEKFINYLKGAGVNVEKTGDHMKLLPLVDKDVLRMSSGKIENAKMMKTKDMTEEQGGLFDFNKTGGKTGNKWSHIKLSEPVINPVFIEPARRLLGLREKDLISLQNNSGGGIIKDMLSKIDVNNRLEELTGAVGNLSGVKKDDAIKQIKYLKVLKESGITPAEAYTIQYLPVIPPLFRPIYPTGDNSNMRVGDINNLYKQVILVNEGLGDKVLDVMPDEEKKSLRRELFGAVKALQGLDKPVSGKDFKGFIAAIKGDVPKEGFFQSKLLKKQQDIAGRATIGGDPSLELDEIKMPEDMAWTLYGPFIIGELVRSGMKIIDAEIELKDRTDKARSVLLMVMKDRPVLLNRAPTLHKFNIMAFKPSMHQGKTLLIPPMVMKPYGADVDGDSLTNSVYCTYDFCGGGMPFSGDTKIRYKYGLVNLRDFPRKELISESKNKEVYKVPENIKVLTVWNGKEEWLRPENFSVHKNLKINEVVTNTSRTIHCSDDHSLVTVDDDLDYVKSKAELGMTIPRLRKPVKEGIECIKEIELPDVDNGKYKMPDVVAVDATLGYFTGAFIGNGWVNNGAEEKTAICFASNEKPVVDFLEEIISVYCNEKVHTNSVASTHTPFDGKECLHTKHTWYVKRLACYLRENIGSGARNKHLPRFWMHTDEDFRWGLLSGLIDTDGAICLNTVMRTRKSIQVTLNYTTTSRVLAYEIVALAHTLNLTASASVIKTPKGEECYCVNFTQESIGVMQRKLVLKNTEKNKRVADYKPNRDYKRNKYTPRLSAHRLKELRAAIYSEAKRHGVNKKPKTDQEQEIVRRCMRLYEIVGGNGKSHFVIPRPSALNIFDLNLDIFSDSFWAKWKNMVLDENVEWELVSEIKPLPFITEAYDLTIPSAYTMVTESGMVVFDTMQVHVPVSEEARREALDKMLPSQNLFSILDKSPHYVPSGEAIFGLYLGTKERTGASLKTYQNAGDVIKDLDLNRIQATDPILLQNIRTTPGSVKVNMVLPPEFRDYNRVITKKTLSEILRQVGQKYPSDYARIAKELKDLGDTWAFSPEASLSFKDFELPDIRNKILSDAGRTLASRKMQRMGRTSPTDIIDVYAGVQDKLIPALMEEGRRKENKFYEWAVSGSRGNPVQLSSIWGAPVLVTDLQDRVIPRPIKRNFIEGLTPGEYFTSLYGARKGITAAKTEVQLPGALAKELTASNVDLIVTIADCGTRKGIDFDISDRDALDRLAAIDVRDSSGNVLVGRNSIITSRVVDSLKKGGVLTIKARSVTTCEALKGVCASCAGVQENGRLPGIGENIGVKHSMSLAEPLTQMALSTKHTAGIAGSKGMGMSAIKTILEMPASVYTKEILAQQDGVVSEVNKLPTGGHIVTVKGTSSEDYLIPPGHRLLKTTGPVSQGEPLTDGIPNIQDYVAIKGIEAGRNKLTETIRDFYRNSGRYIDRRVPETVARGILNYAKVLSPGDFDLVEGDVVEYNQAAPMQTRKVVSLPPGQTVGYRLADSYGKFSKDIRIDRDIARSLSRSSKFKKIGVYKEPARLEPVAFGINKIPVVKKDWLSRLGFRYLSNTITEGAATGMESNIHSMNPIPALAYGAEFGQGKGFDVY